MGPGRYLPRHGRLWNQVHCRGRPAQYYLRGRRIPHRSGEETMNLELSHFSAALLFALFVSIVFGITQREKIKEMLTYGAYCFALFLGGVILAGWVMWLIKR